MDIIVYDNSSYQKHNDILRLTWTKSEKQVRIKWINAS